MSGLRARAVIFFPKIRHALVTFNLFKKPYADSNERRKEMIATRFYVGSMSISMLVVVFYASLIDRPVTVRIESPSLATYQHFALTEPTLRCTCSKVITSYSTFISLHPTFHPLCSSQFVTNLPDPYYFLYSRVENVYGGMRLSTFDFRIASASLLAIFQTFCSVSHEIVNDLLEAFKKKSYISALLTRESELMARAQSFITTFQQQTPRSFNRLLQLIQDTTRGNQLLPASYTNSYVAIDSNRNIEIDWMSPLKMNCSCLTSVDSCGISFNDYCYQIQLSNGGSCFRTETGWITIDGLQLGCYIVDGTLRTTVECLYSPLCIHAILRQISITYPNEVVEQLLTIPPPEAIARFQVNTTLRDIMKELMIEHWDSAVDYENYFEGCKPDVCIYTRVVKFDLAATITITIGLIGGISVLLQLLIPFFVGVVWRNKQLDATPWVQQGTKGEHFLTLVVTSNYVQVGFIVYFVRYLFRIGFYGTRGSFDQTGAEPQFLL